MCGQNGLRTEILKNPVNYTETSIDAWILNTSGHLFYLLSEFDDQILELYTADTYLEWAADVFELRVNPDLHEDERGKEESQIAGCLFPVF